MESDASEIRVIIKELAQAAPAIDNGFQHNLKKLKLKLKLKFYWE